MIVVASFVPRFGSFERNPFSSTSTRVYREGQGIVNMITNSEYFFNF